ncbi:MAG TPA: SPFH domain-containing protein [Polyangiaceae bacterium]|nr:SPFH domain-containing protein [Polyangiaceae bacterium]
MKLTALYLLGLITTAAPFAARALGYEVDTVASVGAILAGATLIALATLLAVFAKLYRRTKASEAFVRTGAGGVRVIRDGGALVIPILHELLAISLQTIKLEVERRNEEALITLDKLRADISAEFFVRVQPDDESILQASRSLGERMGNVQSVRELIEDKLVSALRTAAAGKTLEQLNSERDAFLAEVMKLVADDLLSNGLVLETATISKLDQTDEQYLKAENIFDAQGRRKIAEITQLNLTERNRLVREGEEARKRQDVSAKKLVLEHELSEREAEMEQRTKVAQAQAEAERASEEKRIVAARQVELAVLEKTRSVELASREQQKAIEVAERDKLEAIAQAEQRRTLAEAELELRLAEFERAHQQVETVRVTEAAERDKRKQVIDAEAIAEQKFLTEQRRADGEAYTKQKQAQAELAAADAQASALRTRAEAEAVSEERRAQGERARAMVPVEVERAKVAVAREHVENVVKPELEARELHGKVAQEFEIAKLRIDAEREIRIATAHASASLFQKIQANLYGTPADVARISEAFLKGQSAATTANSFLEAASSDTQSALGKAGASAHELLSALATRLAGPLIPAGVVTPAAEEPIAEAEVRGANGSQ